MASSRFASLDLHGPDGAGPKYLRLKSHVLDELSAGRLKAGDSLPSEQWLANNLTIARTTVRQALAELENDGIIRRVKGQGTFINEQVGCKLKPQVGSFALVVPETRTGFYPSLLHGFGSAARKAHYPVLISNMGNDVAKQADVLMQLMDTDPSGIAIVPVTDPPSPPYQFRQLQRRNIPIVFCHRRVTGINAPLVGISIEEIGRMAGESLLEQGHRRVAFFAGVRSSGSVYEVSLRKKLQQHGGDLPKEFAFQSASISPADAYRVQKKLLPETLKRLLSRKDRPTAIMASFDPLAELIYYFLRDLNVRVPEEVSLIGWGGCWRGEEILRQIASVTVDEEELGRRAAELLQEMHAGQRSLEDTEDVMMPLSLYRAETLGPVSESARKPLQV